MAVPGWRRVFEDFLAKWFVGPLRDAKAYRELGIMGADGRFTRNIYVQWLDASMKIIAEGYRDNNYYLSILFYADPEGRQPKGYQYLYYDLDSEDDVERARQEALELARNVKRRYGADAVVYFTGRKGYAVLVPLKRYVSWEQYRLLWTMVVAPLQLKTLDTKVLDARRVHRIPYTWNVKGKDRGFSFILDHRGRRLRAEDFDWDSYEPMDPSIAEKVVKVDTSPLRSVLGFKVFVGKKPKEPLPDDPAQLDTHKAIPPCMQNIIAGLKAGMDLGHDQRLALVWFLKWIGYPKERVIELFKRYVPDFNEKVTVYQVEYAYGERGRGEDWLMYSCRTMREKGLCLDCGWDVNHKNPVTYVYARALIPEDVRQRFFSKVART